MNIDMEQNKKMQDYEKRWKIDNIKYLIIESPDEYIVFIDNSFDVDWKTTDEYDKNGKYQDPKFHAILSKEANVESIPNDHLQDSIRLNFKRLLGEAIARSLEGHYKNAEELVENARKYILSRNFEAGRYWHMISSTGLGLTLMFLGLALWLFRYSLIPLLGLTGFFVLLSSCGGGIGALLSIISRIGKVDIDSAAGKDINYLEGALRIISGAISGTLIALLIDIGLVLPAFTNNNLHIAMFTFSIVAGSSERWAPSIITQFTNKHENNNSQLKEANSHEKAYPANI